MADNAVPPAVDGMARGEQAARWLAEQPGDNIGYNEAAQRFGVSRRTVKIHWQRLGFKPLAFRGEIAARWLAEQSGDVGYQEAARHFGLRRETVRQAWLQLGFGLGDTPRDKANRATRGCAETAARWLAEQEGEVGYNDAAQHFGISAHLIRAAWRQLQLDETPREKRSFARRETVLDLARTQKNRSQIKKLVGVDKRTISTWCRAAGVGVKSEVGKNGHPAPDAEAMAAGMEVVRAGGSIAEGASVAGVGYTTLRRYARVAKIKPTPRHKQDPQKQAWRRGRSAQAALLVEQEGFSIGEAAAIVEVAPNNVQSYLRRRGS